MSSLVTVALKTYEISSKTRITISIMIDFLKTGHAIDCLKQTRNARTYVQLNFKSLTHIGSAIDALMLVKNIYA